jgi:tRNA modification GTPase
MTQDTIFALSSGPLPAGIAVIRISGGGTLPVLEAMVEKLPALRQASLRSIRNRNGLLLDQGLVLFFPGPASFTGEDCAELQVHGSRAVVSAISTTLTELGCRHAEAGEFARRAFEHGRLDLVEVEGLADLVSAETEMQRRLALQTGLGPLSEKYQDWSDRLTFARAMIEAELDFSDEEDVPGSASELVEADLQKLREEMIAAGDAARSAEVVRNGYKVAIIGAPNAGKSSLLNALARREVAIVTDIAGTTRDVLTVDIDLEGYLVRFYDTAGLRESEDVVEQEGIRRAKLAADDADLVLHLIADGSVNLGDHVLHAPVLRVKSKSDLSPANAEHDLAISTVTGEGLDTLHAIILDRLTAAWAMGTAAGKQRHLEHIKQASFWVDMGLKEPQLELKADALRAASDALGRITGRVDVEDLLGVIFSRFCIGK